MVWHDYTLEYPAHHSNTFPFFFQGKHHESMEIYRDSGRTYLYIYTASVRWKKPKLISCSCVFVTMYSTSRNCGKLLRVFFPAVCLLFHSIANSLPTPRFRSGASSSSSSLTLPSRRPISSFASENRARSPSLMTHWHCAKPILRSTGFPGISSSPPLYIISGD